MTGNVPELEPADVDADDPGAEARPVPIDLVGTASIGLMVGTLTGGRVWTLYPPARGQVSPIVEVLVGSLLLVVGLYVTIARARRLRAADWLVVGYVVGLVGFAAFCIGEEMVTFLRHHTAALIGIPVA